MRVLVTGGTGFVGSHSAAALVDRGHDVRLLVRDPSRVARAFGPLGTTVADVAVGDMTDSKAVAKAVRGCDAVLHAAAVYTFDSRKRSEIAAVNVRGTEVVLGAACNEGCDPVVHVSTPSALLPQQARLTPDLPVGSIATPYSRSKAESDRVARRWQDGGAPVVITYPGIVMGPDDPYLGESSRFIASVLRGQAPFQLKGVLPAPTCATSVLGTPRPCNPGADRAATCSPASTPPETISSPRCAASPGVGSLRFPHPRP